MAFYVTDEIQVDVSKLTIEEQLELCKLLVKSGYVVERRYRFKEKGTDIARSFVAAGKRGGVKDV